MTILWVAISALIFGTIAFHYSRQRKERIEYHELAKERWMQTRNQTMRLNELNLLQKKLDQTNNETRSLKEAVSRLDFILREIEGLIEEGNLTLSETLLSRFSKHLRQLLHEGASDEILIREAFEYLESCLSMMAAMSRHSWAFEIHKENFAELDSNRKVKSLIVTPWIFNHLWQDCLDNKIETSVQIFISSDTYDTTINLSYNGKDESMTLELQ